MLSGNEKYKRLIIRCLQGEANAVEQQKTERWVNRSEKNRRLFNMYKDLFLLTSLNTPVYDTEKALSKVKHRIENSKGLVVDKKPGLNFSQIVRIAVPAVAAMLLIGVEIGRASCRERV